jgi:hypothetical protein
MTLTSQWLVPEPYSCSSFVFFSIVELSGSWELPLSVRRITVLLNSRFEISHMQDISRCRFPVVFSDLPGVDLN